MNKSIVFLFLLIVPSINSLIAQKNEKKIAISGQVVDVNNMPVTSAPILIDNKKTRIKTDAKGMYVIRVKSSALKIAVFEQANGQIEEEINGRRIINFNLPKGMLQQTEAQEKNSDNNEVNVGYGSASKNSIITPPGSVNGSEENTFAYQNIYEMIQGQVAGVRVQGNKIYIRGITTNGNTDPLFVVNGMEVTSINNINPQDVKSIEVLKGGSTSIYGTKGANGVILITLKR